MIASRSSLYGLSHHAMRAMRFRMVINAKYLSAQRVTPSPPRGLSRSEPGVPAGSHEPAIINVTKQLN
jgi:hypothetical protein